MLRPAWIEINLKQLRYNLAQIRKDFPPALQWCSVVKDQAYGHGAIAIARETIKGGASFLAVATIDEALDLRQNNRESPILIFGERTEQELEYCLKHNFVYFVNNESQAKYLNRIATQANKRISVHIEIDTGLSRYGVRWTSALRVIEKIQSFKNLSIDGIMTHFAMSDELDKTFVNEQLRRFHELLKELQERKIKIPLCHACNTGGYLDVPQAHFNMVRMGILPLGVYPSKVCRRLDGLVPIMEVKTRIASLQNIGVGDHVGYGMRYTAPSARMIATLPLGYGDGYPRLRNTGHVLIRNQKAPIVGGNAMDAIMVDVTKIVNVKQWDEVVVLGSQNEETISVHELAEWGNTVSYDIMTKWSPRLPRVYIDTKP